MQSHCNVVALQSPSEGRLPGGCAVLPPGRGSESRGHSRSVGAERFAPEGSLGTLVNRLSGYLSRARRGVATVPLSRERPHAPALARGEHWRRRACGLLRLREVQRVVWGGGATLSGGALCFPRPPPRPGGLTHLKRHSRVPDDRPDASCLLLAAVLLVFGSSGFLSLVRLLPGRSDATALERAKDNSKRWITRLVRR